MLDLQNTVDATDYDYARYRGEADADVNDYVGTAWDAKENQNEIK